MRPATQGDNFDSDVGQPILAAPDLSRSGTGRLESRLQARLPAPHFRSDCHSIMRASIISSSKASIESRCGTHECARHKEAHPRLHYQQPPMKISAAIIAFNEERNISRVIESLRCCDEIVVVDSGSTDRTVELAAKHGARVFETACRGLAAPKNFAS